MTTQPRLALTFEDVLLVPRRSSVRSRRHVATRSRFSRGLELAIPIVSANMDTVTTAPMAIAMPDLGLRDRWPQASRDEHGRLRVAAAVGVRGGYLARAEALLDAGVDALVVDVAHGHADHTIEAVRELKATWPDAEVVAGNVATAEGFRDLASAGA